MNDENRRDLKGKENEGVSECHHDPADNDKWFIPTMPKYINGYLPLSQNQKKKSETNGGNFTKKCAKKYPIDC